MKKCRKKITNKPGSLKEVVSMKYPQCFRLYEVASMRQAQSGSLRIPDISPILQPQKLTLPHSNEVISHQWGWLTKIRLPHNNIAASQQGGCLTTISLPHSNEATSQKLGCPTTIWLPHNEEARGCLITMRLPQKVDSTQGYFNANNI